ncbi:MAG: cation transporter [Trueperaceae bacterium]|nr:MAG: cation transporter [Trueperaceae bacterium]
MDRVLLGVRGMDTEESKTKVTTRLQGLEGVSKVEATNDQQLFVEYDPGVLTVMDLIRTLRSLGFLAGIE